MEFNCEKVVMPIHNSRIGNPVVLPKIYFNILINLKDDFTKTLEQLEKIKEQREVHLNLLYPYHSLEIISSN